MTPIEAAQRLGPSPDSLRSQIRHGAAAMPLGLSA
jgi:hypothetical protein